MKLEELKPGQIVRLTPRDKAILKTHKDFFDLDGEFEINSIETYATFSLEDLGKVKYDITQDNKRLCLLRNKDEECFISNTSNTMNEKEKTKLAEEISLKYKTDVKATLREIDKILYEKSCEELNSKSLEDSRQKWIDMENNLKTQFKTDWVKFDEQMKDSKLEYNNYIDYSGGATISASKSKNSADKLRGIKSNVTNLPFFIGNIVSFTDVGRDYYTNEGFSEEICDLHFIIKNIQLRMGGGNPYFILTLNSTNFGQKTGGPAVGSLNVEYEVGEFESLQLVRKIDSGPKRNHKLTTMFSY